MFFNLDNDISLCGVYLWGDDSPAYNTVNIDLFECLEYDITYYESKGSVYPIGDFNSRIGDKKDFVVFDSVNHCFDEFDYVPDYNMERASMDKKVTLLEQNCLIFVCQIICEWLTVD